MFQNTHLYNDRRSFSLDHILRPKDSTNVAQRTYFSPLAYALLSTPCIPSADSFFGALRESPCRFKRWRWNWSSMTRGHRGQCLAT